MDHAPEHLLQTIERLRVPARLVITTLTRYYHEQLEPEHFHAAPEDLAAALAEIRRALSCRALVSEKLSAGDQAQVLEVLGPRIPTPRPDEVPGSQTDHIDTLLQQASIGLICWHARTATTFALFAEDQDQLPDCERFRHGDRVMVRAADRTSTPYNGCSGKFQRYSDPRICHPDRWAVVNLDGQEEVLIRPAHLEFALEEEELDGGQSNPLEDDLEEFDTYEHIGTWSRDGFTLRLYDTGQTDRLGKSLLAYQLHDQEHGRAPIFRGADFHCSPLQDRASDGAAADVLGFLSLEPGDTDSDRFASYTPQQLQWCEDRAQDLAVVAEQLQQRHHCRELSRLDRTDDAVFILARHNPVEDLLEVLDMDIFETYDFIADLCRRRSDPILHSVLGELHFLRDVELAGGEEELVRFYE